MLLPRTKLVEEFRELFALNEHQYIAIVAPSLWGKTRFIKLLQNAGILDKETTEYAASLDMESFQMQKPKTIVFDSTSISDISNIRTFIESNLLNSRVIFTTTDTGTEEDVSYFEIPWISFREYAEWYGSPIEIWAILAWTANITKLNTLRDEYIHTWQHGYNISNPENIDILWDEKITLMVWELFEKEKEDFVEYIRTLAMWVGDLFKADRIAKTMNISRRKVHKYTELLMKHSIIRAIWPFWDYPETELFRHVKIYFNDLSYLAIALGVGYYHGPTKQWVLENFVFLELDRKLDDSHEIRFYRKKSGAEVSFVLIDKNSGFLTPIDITLRPTDIIPLSLKLFEETYHEKIERVMFMNEEKAWQKELNGKMLIVLPHVAI
jgi:predicted AAA+ superfamily ATPase